MARECDAEGKSMSLTSPTARPDAHNTVGSPETPQWLRAAEKTLADTPVKDAM